MADSSLDIKMNDLKLTDSPTPALVPDHTPSEAYASTFEPMTPPLDPLTPSASADQEDEVEELLEHDASSLKSDDVKSDPILAALAKQQSRPVSQASLPQHTSAPAFKARPAPVRKEGVGPRMTKSAALRQGLDWTAMSSKAPAADAGKPPVQQKETPKQVSLLISDETVTGTQVASLSVPDMAPRANRSSILRSGEATAPALPKKDYAAQALINKADEKEERDRRRKSVALPASLSQPSGMVPRGNRSSILRAGGAPGLAVVKKDYAAQALINKANEKEARDLKRKSVALPASLSTPSSSVPLGNRSSILRAGGAPALAVGKKDYAAQALINKANEKEERDRKRKSVALPASLGAPSTAPRQNRSSELRTGVPVLPSTRALAVSSAPNVDHGIKPTTVNSKADLARRVSLGLKSLDAPSIAPRLNKAALLRAPALGSPSSPVLSKTRPTTVNGGSSASSRPSHVRGQSTSSASKSANTPASPLGPKPTKSSLLRAGLGARILARGV